jgi:hypothetical protein
MDHKKSTRKKVARAKKRSPAIKSIRLTTISVGGAIWQQK